MATSDSEVHPNHARLTDGRVVQLEKDCGCVHHEGPHWLHIDRHDQLANQRTFMSLSAQVNRRTDHGSWAALYDAYVVAEQARLRDKRQQMERRGIAQLLYPDEVEHVA